MQRPDSERKDAEYKKRSFLYSASKNQFLCKQTQRSSRVARFFYCKPNFRKQLGRMKILIKYRTNCNNRLNLSICNLMKFIYITKPLPVFNKKFRENSGNPSSMFIYKKNGYKEKLRLLYSASFGQKMRSFVSECRLRHPPLIRKIPACNRVSESTCNRCKDLQRK